MEVSNGALTNMWINPYTWKPTTMSREEFQSTYQGEVVKRFANSKDTLQGDIMDYTKELEGRSTALIYKGPTWLNRQSNSINFGKGATATLSGGYTLVLGDRCVEWRGDLKNEASIYGYDAFRIAGIRD